MHKNKRLIDSYQFDGYKPSETLKGIFGDPKARIIQLQRREKKRFVHCVAPHTGVITTERHVAYAIFPVEICEFTSIWRYAEFNAGGVRK